MSPPIPGIVIDRSGNRRVISTYLSCQRFSFENVANGLPTMHK